MFALNKIISSDRFDGLFPSKGIHEAIKTGQAKGIAAVTNYLMKSASEGNVTAQIFYLKNRSPENWNDKYHIEEKRRYVRKDVEVTAKMAPQEAAHDVSP